MPSGEELSGVYLPAEGPPSEEAALILGFGGNAWNADTLAVYLHSVFPDRDVVAFHYRGYAPSTGRPSARALLQDTLPIHDHLVATLAPNRIVAVGLSIGAGLAAHLASQRPIAGLILVTPFDSPQCLREHYPWAPVGPLLRHRMEIADSPAASSVPLALIAAERDTIVPSRPEQHRCAGPPASSFWTASSWMPVTTISTTAPSSSVQCVRHCCLWSSGSHFGG